PAEKSVFREAGVLSRSTIGAILNWLPTLCPQGRLIQLRHSSAICAGRVASAGELELLTPFAPKADLPKARESGFSGIRAYAMGATDRSRCSQRASESALCKSPCF